MVKLIFTLYVFLLIFADPCVCTTNLVCS